MFLKCFRNISEMLQSAIISNATSLKDSSNISVYIVFSEAEKLALKRAYSQRGPRGALAPLYKRIEARREITLCGYALSTCRDPGAHPAEVSRWKGILRAPLYTRCGDILLMSLTPPSGGAAELRRARVLYAREKR